MFLKLYYFKPQTQVRKKSLSQGQNAYKMKERPCEPQVSQQPSMYDVSATIGHFTQENRPLLASQQNSSLASLLSALLPSAHPFKARGNAGLSSSVFLILPHSGSQQRMCWKPGLNYHPLPNLPHSKSLALMQSMEGKQTLFGCLSDLPSTAFVRLLKACVLTTPPNRAQGQYHVPFTHVLVKVKQVLCLSERPPSWTLNLVKTYMCTFVLPGTTYRTVLRHWRQNKGTSLTGLIN